MNRAKTSRKSPSPNIKEFHEELNKYVEKSGMTVPQLVKKGYTLRESTVYRMLDCTCSNVPKRENLALVCVALNLDLNERNKLWSLAYPEDLIYSRLLTEPDLSADEFVMMLDDVGCLPNDD